MSRKRDTNWSKDEITVLLDSIMEITRTRADDSKKTNSREVFEYAAKKMAEKGHASRAEREKCRTKWKKMKEEFTHAKRAREGDLRYKEAPGIQPFYDRMEEFINGNYDNISPHSTIVRRTSSLTNRPSPGMRTSARIAASTNGTSSTDNNDTSSTIVTKTTNHSSDYPSSINTPSNQASPSSRQNSRLSSGSNHTNALPTAAPAPATNPTTATTPNLSLSTSQNLNQHHQHQLLQQQQQQQQQTHPAISNGGLCALYTSCNNDNNVGTTNGNCGGNSSSNLNQNNIIANSKDTSTPTTSNTSVLNHSNESPPIQPTEHADISYRVSSGCRQITIFGDHDVDIKFRGDCVTINKIDPDYQVAET